MPGHQGQHRHQGQGGAQPQPEDHISQVGAQPRADGAPPAGELVGKAPGGHTAALTETQRGVPEMIWPSQTILPQGSELSGARNLSLSLSLPQDSEYFTGLGSR